MRKFLKSLRTFKNLWFMTVGGCIAGGIAFGGLVQFGGGAAYEAAQIHIWMDVAGVITATIMTLVLVTIDTFVTPEHIMDRR